MRKIGAVLSKEHGDLLAGYLQAQGIDSQIEQSSDGGYAVWILSDDCLKEAGDVLQAFLANPDDPLFSAGASAGLKKLQDERHKDERFQKNYRDRNRVFDGARMGIVTSFLLVASCLVSILTRLGDDVSLTNMLFLTPVDYINSSYDITLPEIRNGAVWRLLTPVFVHFSFMHLLFNMMWLSDLGSVLERRHGSLPLLLFVMVIAVPSNFLQFLVSGPSFGGMSGVVYGLLGYLWIRAKTDPFYDIHLRPNTVVLMGIWFVLCIAIPQLNVANTVHGAGLAVGAAGGYIAGVIGRTGRFKR